MFFIYCRPVVLSRSLNVCEKDACAPGTAEPGRYAGPLRAGRLRARARGEQPAVLPTHQRLMRCQERRGASAHLADAYDEMVVHARRELGLDATTTRTVLTGWSRGAAFSVLVASEPAAAHPVLGVIAVGLAEGEDLQISAAEDDTDDTPARRFYAVDARNHRFAGGKLAFDAAFLRRDSVGRLATRTTGWR